MSLKIILIGYGELAEALLSGILTTEHKLVALLSWDRRTHTSRFLYNIMPDSLELLRRKANIPPIDVKSVNSFEFIQIASDLKPDVILIGSWGQILKRHIIDVPKYCINCHPSYLPFHRGSNPYASTIINGEKFTGVTFHEVDEGIDTGRIIMQQKILIDIQDNGETLRYKCTNLAKSMVPELLDSIEAQNINFVEQDKRIASYFPRLKVEDGSIDWSNEALKIHNQIRGLYPWLYCYSNYRGKLVLIKESELIDIENNNPQPGKILKIYNNNTLVETTTPGKALILKKMSLFGYPEFISKIYLKKLLKEGEFFTNAM